MKSDKKAPSRIAIVGGTVIDPANDVYGLLNVIVENGMVVEVSDREPEAGSKVIVVGGCIVTPGFIDLHVHLREPGQEHKENIQSGCRAAAAGGFTAVACMPNTDPVNDTVGTTEFILGRAEEVADIHVYPVGAITKGSQGKELADIEGMIRAGAIAFSDDGGCVQDEALMREAVTLAKKRNALIIDHAEDFSISGRESENVIIERDIELAREIGARVHIAHLSTREGVKAIHEAKANGISITCEVTPHHLLLTEDDVKLYGANAVMKPPLRTEADRRALVAGLADGTIDAIATDHAPHAADEKADISTSAYGVIGMETMLPVCLKLVHQGQVSMRRFVEAITSAPAGILKCRGGSLKPGSPADITIFDPAEDVVIDSSKFLSKSRNTPFHGWKCKSRVKYTMVQGEVVYTTGDH